MINDIMMLIKVILEWMINTETGLLIAVVGGIVLPILGFATIVEVLNEEV